MDHVVPTASLVREASLVTAVASTDGVALQKITAELDAKTASEHAAAATMALAPAQLSSSERPLDHLPQLHQHRPTRSPQMRLAATQMAARHVWDPALATAARQVDGVGAQDHTAEVDARLGSDIVTEA